MLAEPSSPSGLWATTTAALTQSTMTGLYMFEGAARFDSDTIIAITLHRFVVVPTENLNVFDQHYLARTVAATMTTAGVSNDPQITVIQAKKNEYRLPQYLTP
jgi:hypothetical protein